jgi:hypothetical protein
VIVMLGSPWSLNASAVSSAALAVAFSARNAPVAENTVWEQAGITGPVVTSAIVRGLVQRDPVGQLWLTKEGRAAFQELIGSGA